MAYSRTFRYLFSGNLISGLTRASTAMDGLTLSSKRTVKSLNLIGGAITRNIALPLGIIGGLSVSTFAKLEKGLQQVKNLATKAEWKEFGPQWKEAQREAVLRGAFSINELNDALFDMPSALGFSKYSLIAYNEAVKLSIAGNADLDGSVLGMSRVWESYKNVLDESGNKLYSLKQIGSGMFEAQVIASVNLDVFNKQIGKITASSKMADYTLGEMLATAAGYTKFLPAAQAFTAMNATLRAFSKPMRETRLWAVTMANLEFGTKLPRLLSEFKKLDKMEFLKDIITLLKTPRGADFLSLIVPRAKAMKGMGNLNDELLATIIHTKNLIDSGKVSAKFLKALSENMDLTSYKLGLVKGAIVVTADAIGKRLTPGVLDLAEHFKTVLFEIEGFIERNPEFTSKLMKSTFYLSAFGIGALVVAKIISGLGMAAAFLGISNSILIAKASLLTFKGLLGVVSRLALGIGAAILGWNIGKQLAETDLGKLFIDELSKEYAGGMEMIQGMAEHHEQQMKRSLEAHARGMEMVKGMAESGINSQLIKKEDLYKSQVMRDKIQNENIFNGTLDITAKGATVNSVTSKITGKMNMGLNVFEE